MHITVVYGTKRKGCTHHIAQMVTARFPDAEIKEVILPDDLPTYCISCMKCFLEKQGTCTHEMYTRPIREKLLWADVLILTSPVYAFYVTGQMKVFLDHFSNMWMVHRPEKKMFRKQGIVIATASGPVYRKTLSEMKDSLDFWGVPKVYKLGFALMNTDWENVSAKIKRHIEKEVDHTVKATARRYAKAENKNHVHPSFRVWKWFMISRMMQKHIKANPPDVQYWTKMGWTGHKRPWKWD
jgi:multimeric flavodoxin WrbA